MKAIESLDDLTPDPGNANAGTLRGEQLLETSLSQYGAGRTIVVDKHGVVIGGNKTLQLAIEAGLSLRLVKSDGSKLVAVVRTDLDLETDPAARMLAYLDNRVSEVGLSWKPEQLDADLASGLALGTLFTEPERRAVLEALVETEAPEPPPSLTATLLFTTPAMKAQWRAAVALIEGYPGTTFTDKLDAWVAEQLATFHDVVNSAEATEAT